MAKLIRTLRRGATAGLKTNGGDHLCIMLTDAVKLPGKGTRIIMQVHLTSSKSIPQDPACKFKAGDDKLITKDCWVYYAEAQVRDIAEVEDEIRKRNRKVRMISPQTLKRVIEGLLASPLTPPGVRKHFLEARRRGLAD